MPMDNDCTRYHDTRGDGEGGCGEDVEKGIERICTPRSKISAELSGCALPCKTLKISMPDVTIIT